MESLIAKKKTLLTLEFNNMKDNFDKLFNVVLVLTAFAKQILKEIQKIIE